MPKKRREHDPAWEIFRIANRNIYLGRVMAPDEKKAIKTAIEEIPVSNPEHQTRLVARKVD